MFYTATSAIMVSKLFYQGCCGYTYKQSRFCFRNFFSYMPQKRKDSFLKKFNFQTTMEKNVGKNSINLKTLCFYQIYAS